MPGLSLSEKRICTNSPPGSRQSARAEDKPGIPTILVATREDQAAAPVRPSPRLSLPQEWGVIPAAPFGFRLLTITSPGCAGHEDFRAAAASFRSPQRRTSAVPL